MLSDDSDSWKGSLEWLEALSGVGNADVWALAMQVSLWPLE